MWESKMYGLFMELKKQKGDENPLSLNGKEKDRGRSKNIKAKLFVNVYEEILGPLNFVKVAKKEESTS